MANISSFRLSSIPKLICVKIEKLPLGSGFAKSYIAAIITLGIKTFEV